MQELKFRAWHEKLNLMRSVCMIEFDDTGRDELIHVWDHPSERAAKIKGRISTWKKKDCILIQSTGLHDRNGKDIFEGNVLLPHAYMGTINSKPGNEWFIFKVEVIFDEGMFCLKPNGTAITEKRSLSCSLKEASPVGGYVIIGNRFEHPRLLTA